MDPVVYFDESLQTFFQRQATDEQETEVGLLVGCIRPQCEVLDCLPIPEDDIDEGPEPLPERLASAVLDHGCLVNRILPGGLVIVGVYCFEHKAESRALATSLKKALKRIHEHGPSFEGPQERWMLELELPGTKRTLTRIPISRGHAEKETTGKAQFHKIEPLVPVTCRYRFHFSSTLAEEAPLLKTIRKQIIASQSASLQESVPVINSKLVEPTQAVKDAGNGSLQLQLWMPFGPKEEIKEAAAKSYFTLQGVLDCRAMCSMTDTLQTAIEYLKMDILQSIESRMRILEESYGTDDEDPVLEAGQMYELPRRVWGAWKFGAQLSDYLSRGESEDDALHNIEELIHFTLTATEDIEKPLIASAPPEQWDPFQVRRPEEKARLGMQMPAIYLWSLLLALFAIGLGILLYLISPSKDPDLHILH